MLLEIVIFIVFASIVSMMTIHWMKILNIFTVMYKSKKKHKGANKELERYINQIKQLEIKKKSIKNNDDNKGYA